MVAGMTEYEQRYNRMRANITAGGLYGQSDLDDIVDDAIADARQSRALVAQEHLARRQLTIDDIAIIRDVVARGADDGELRLFVAICNHTGLDPFLKQIWLIPRRAQVPNPHGPGKIWAETHQPQVSIDGFRLLAQRTKRYAGMEGPFWCGPDGLWLDLWLAPTNPVAAKVGVLVRGWDRPLWATAKWDEYRQADGDGNLTTFWKRYPTLMLANAAERLALRRAFPAELARFSVIDDDGSEIVDAPAAAIDAEWSEVPEAPVDPVDHGDPPASAPAAPAEGVTLDEFRAATGHTPGEIEQMAMDTPTEPATPASVAPTAPGGDMRGGANAPADPDAVRRYEEGLAQAAALDIDGLDEFDIDTATVTRGELKTKALKLRAAIDDKTTVAEGAP